MASQGRDDVIVFTAEAGFTIEKLAVTIVQMMQDMDMDAQVKLPSGATLEIDKECTTREIIEGYKDFMADHITARTASNKNEPQPVK
jgi:hypothetical protein